MALIEELKRRKVFKVGTAYLVVAWVLIQVTATVAPQFDFPIWAPRLITFVLLLGFPVALLFAWVLERTPDGIRLDTGTRGNRIMFVAAAALVVLAVAWYYKGQPSYRAGDVPASGGPSVAVLPFANMSGKVDEDYFSDGMTEELLNVLAKIPKLDVAARTSVFEFKGKGGDVREIGRKLGVNHIVEGSVRREGDQVRITAQLIRVADGFHVWSETYDRELKGVFALQDEIARQIGGQLQRRLGVGDMPAARAAIDPVAYDEYLKGRALYRQRTSLPEAARHLARAVEIAPQFGAGWASLALTHEVMYWTTTAAERAQVGDSYAQLIAAAERATTLDPVGAMTLHARANVARAQGRYGDALRLYRQAIAADPSYPDVREDYSELLVGVGNVKDGESAIRELLKVDSRIGLYWWRLGSLGLYSGRPELVDEAIARMREIDPNYRYGQFARLMVPLEQGRIEEARAVLEDALRIAPEAMAPEAIMFHWAARDPGADEATARRMVAEMNLRSSYAALRGDLDLLLASFENEDAHTSRHGFFIALATPIARHWLPEPRVKQLLAKYGFVAYWREAGWPRECRPLGADDFACGDAAAKG